MELVRIFLLSFSYLDWVRTTVVPNLLVYAVHITYCMYGQYVIPPGLD